MRPYLQRPEQIAGVHLVVTDTQDGKLCAEVLERYLRGVGIRQVSRHTLPARETLTARPDDPEPSDELIDGLVDLRDHLLEFIRRRQDEGLAVLLNATGGFKPEVAVLVSVGGLLAVPVYYVHESFRETVLLPPFCLPHDRAAALASFLARFPVDRRLTGPAAQDFYRQLKGQGLWEQAVDLHVVRAEYDHGAETPHTVALTAIGRYVLHDAAQTAGSAGSS